MNDAQEYLVETPEVVLPPSPPQPNQPNRTNSTTHPSNDEPVHQNRTSVSNPIAD